MRFQLQVEGFANHRLKLDMKKWGTVKNMETAKSLYDAAKLAFKGGYAPPGV